MEICKVIEELKKGTPVTEAVLKSSHEMIRINKVESDDDLDRIFRKIVE